MRLHIPAQQNKFVEYRCTNNINYNVVRHEVQSLNLMTHIHSGNCTTDDAFTLFHSQLCSIFERHAPLVRKRVAHNCFPLMNKELSCTILYRNRMRNKFYKQKASAYFVLYKDARNKVTKLKRKLLKSYFLSKCKGGSSNKKFWRTIKPFCSNKSNKGGDIVLKENNEIISEPTELCNIFNQFFVQIGSTHTSNGDHREALFSIINRLKNHQSIELIRERCNVNVPFDMRPVSVRQVKKTIRGLKKDKAAGNDSIPPVFLIKLVNEIAEPITVLFNRCIQDCTFPSTLKMSDICPVYKKKDPLDKDNYRSINLLPGLSKVFEALIHDQLVTYSETFTNKLLSGFRKGHGCQDILSKLLSDWKKCLDNRGLLGVMAIDLSKAFDSMPHDLLLAKLYAYGISYNCCKLLQSYLRDRKQRVKIESSRSEWVTPVRGVPQGSKLGPLLFNCFINDLLYMEISSTIYNYADDNTLSCSGNDIMSIKSCLAQDANVVMNWFDDNYMSANPSKFQIMFMGAGVDNDAYELEVGNVKLMSVNTVTILGLEIDNKLCFNDHIDHMCQKTAAQINAMSRIKCNLDTTSLLVLYNSFIVSNFQYCNIVWMFTSKTSLKKLDRLNERAIRLVYNDKSTNYQRLMSENKHLDIYKLCMKSLLCTMYKIWNNVSPTYISDIFRKNAISNYNLRDDKKFILPLYTCKKFGYHCIDYIGAKAWNDLPTHIKARDTLPSFKHNLKMYLLNLQYGALIDNYF